MRRLPVVLCGVVLLVACGLSLWHTLDDDDVVTAATTPPTTSKAAGPAIASEGFENLFVPGPADTTGGAAVTLSVLDGGLLDVPSGRLIACDPYVQATDHEYVEPFAVTVPPGRYPVTVAVATFEDDAMLVTAARLVVRQEPVVEWRPATRGDEDVADLAPDTFYGFGVDAGTGAFVDEAALPALTRLAGSEEGALAKVTADDYDLLVWNVRDEVSGRNVVAYATGYGDGTYPTWIGYTAAGHVAQFVTDLLVAVPPRR